MKFLFCCCHLLLLLLLLTLPLTLFLPLVGSELRLSAGSAENSQIVAEEEKEKGGCQWRHTTNVTDPQLLPDEHLTELENCLWDYLMAEARETSIHLAHPLLSPPPVYPLQITAEGLQVEQVDTLARTSVEFNVFGHMLISWNDTRLHWPQEEWAGLEVIALKEEAQLELWTPTFSDESNCGPVEGCLAKLGDLSVSSSGLVLARLVFRFPSFCKIDYKSYPEEKNDCCLFLGMADIGRTVKFLVESNSKAKTLANKPVSVSKVEQGGMTTIILTNLETSPWTVQSQAIKPVRIEGIRGEHFQLCVHVKKEMSTLRVALRIPVTIATLLMLVSPLFGDLRTQALVKLLTLTLQTICFLFLCSIAPPGGFGGTKPKLYTFYEFMFSLTFLSILVTTCCLALCRMKRTVPAAHGLYLGAKMLNHFLCCIEPDPATNYQRHLEDNFDTVSTRGGGGMAPSSINGPPASHQNDYSMEWRHIYIAANNLFSGLCFSLFCFIIIFDIM